MLKSFPSAVAKRCAVIAASIVLSVTPAFATGNLAPVQSTLQTLVSVLTGQISTSLAVLAVISLGFFAWAGRLTWAIAGSVIFGIVLVFGSVQIVQFFQSAVGQ
ncbi:TrbC/VIRB2 family protein [Methylosinus sp. H3A]|uniref:TrbC/VirB2 family protein n=1 Tax=Methylosinus sp. H3A TaxID=2785786 RepID=UPI0018C2F9F3|nr:TrbC/VirB2 family protein [Methylosinus sp. H3A]MBG0812361.1 TrbC/VIRB2 family protein [Methylosinus sp. H3A]